MNRNYIYKTNDGYSTGVTLYGADKFGEQPCIVYLHGFKGFKDWGFVPHAGEFFAANGYCFLAANFSHNGVTEHEPEITDLDKFRKNTLMREMEEAGEFIRLAQKGSLFGVSSSQPVLLIGHSRGGGVGILAASRNPDLKAIATWAAISQTDRFDKKGKTMWKKQGFVEVVNSRTGAKLPLDYSYLEEIERFSRTRLNILEALKTFKRPALIVHGQKDETVPFYEAEMLHIYAEPLGSRLRVVPNTGHTFGISHPFEASTPEFDLVLNDTLEFFNQVLLPKEA